MTENTPPRRHSFVSLLALVSLLPGVLAPVLVAAPASAVTVDGTSWTAGAGTYTAANGTVYARLGQSLMLTASVSNGTDCVRFYDGNQGARDRQERSLPVRVRRRAGDGSRTITVKA